MSEDTQNTGPKAPRRVTTRGGTGTPRPPAATGRPASRSSSSAAAGPSAPPASRVSRATTAGSSRRPSSPRAVEPEAEPDRRHTTRSAELVQMAELGVKDRTMTYIWVTTAVLVVLGAVIGWISYSVNKDKDEAERAALVASKEAADRCEETLRTDPTNFQRILAVCDDADPKCKDFPKDRARVNGVRTITISNRDAAEAKERADALLKECQDTIKDVKKLASVEAKIRQLEIFMNAQGDDYKKAVIQLKEELLVAKLKAAAVTAEEKAYAAGTDLPVALEAYDEAMNEFAKFFKARTNIKPEDPALQLYMGLVRKSDELVNKLITKEYEEQTAVRDLLSPKERSGGMWINSPGVKFEFAGRELIVEDIADDKLQGLLSIDGWTIQFWDFVLDLEFEIVSGGFDLFLRFVPGSKAYSMTYVGGKEGFDIGKPYRMQFRCKGSRVTVEQPDQPQLDDTFGPSTSRSGGVAFACHNGAKIIIRQAKLKVLRPRGGVK